ncbi:MAG: transglutaminase-like domain-containing protein [Leptolyngbya sp. IPPAS B-1204]|nr:transglutaminase domain-containing protein [Elainella sp. C42_A2020_010]RNJ67048.1 MAG: transglutaminase domain-containing protein [Leptolyngbya sp. IPPAS B-1204]
MRRYAAPPLSLPQVNLGLIPKGYLGTQSTLNHIQVLIQAGAKDFYVRQKAIDILLEKAIRPKDYLGEIKALFEWVQQNVRYTKDPFRVEVLHSARRMLELRAGDCDDMAILLGSMLEAIGHPVRLVITGPDPLRPKLFSHIYLEVFHQGRWIPLDATMPYPMGWEPQTFVKQMIPMERKVTMMHSPPVSYGLAPMSSPNWLPGLIQSIRQGGIQPNDSRMKALLDLLHQRQLLRQKPRLAKQLNFIWVRGLSARPYPKTARGLERSLQQWGILPTSPIPLPAQSDHRPQMQPSTQSVRPVALRAVGKVKPVASVAPIAPTSAPIAQQ